MVLRKGPIIHVRRYDHAAFLGDDLLSREDLGEMGVEAEGGDLERIWQEVARNKRMDGQLCLLAGYVIVVDTQLGI